MKNEKADAERVWKLLEDVVVPRLNLSVSDRVVYSYLLRHSRLERRRQLRFSLAELSRGARVSRHATRLAVRRLLKHGALQLIRRSSAGHAMEVRLPDEIRAAMDPRVGRRSGVAQDARLEGTAPAGAAPRMKPGKWNGC
jgi:predicted DNA-binding transcriptional regulator